MRILFLVPYTPTPIRTRPYNLVRTLARRGHAVTLATLWENEQERAALKEMENQGVCVIAGRLTKLRSVWNCLRAIPTALPLQAVYCWQPDLAGQIKSAANDKQYDIIHVEHLRGACYALHSPISTLQSPVVWDSVDCISNLFEQATHYSRSGFGRLVTRFELPRTKKQECWLVNQFDRVLVTSSVDATALKTLQNHMPNDSHPSDILVLPNGVDLEYFSPVEAPREPATIVFSGKMSYHANVAAALHLVQKIMPIVWKERSNVQLLIVGQNPPLQVSQLAATHRPLVTVTGRIPDLRPYLQRATLAVAPMSYGAGIQNKVLEAMACATPVVATSQAVSALRACPDEHLLVADEPTAFARKVLQLLDDRELQRRIGNAGRGYVEQHHDWDRIVERLEDIYRELGEKGRRSADR